MYVIGISLSKFMKKCLKTIGVKMRKFQKEALPQLTVQPVRKDNRLEMTTEPDRGV
jgi:hypothetical protein